jgi:SET domain-containing protein
MSSRGTQVSSWTTRGKSAIHGRGIYARRPIPDGTRVVEYMGERITKREAARREARRLARQRCGGDDCVYVFELNRRHDLDGRTRRNVARLINHSCAPNCRAETIRGRIWIIARREIPAGEELTYDYGFSFKEWRLHPCRFIVARDQRWRLRKIPRGERARVISAAPLEPAGGSQSQHSNRNAQRSTFNAQRSTLNSAIRSPY